jgi:hypothetical protein
MVPVEIHGNDPRGLLPEIFDDREIVIFNPFYSQVYDLGGNAIALQKVGQSQEPHGHEVDPDEMTDRPVIIGQLGDMEKKKFGTTHGGNCKMLPPHISTSSQKIAKAKRPPTPVRGSTGTYPFLPPSRKGYNIKRSYFAGKPLRHTQGRELCRTVLHCGRGASNLRFGIFDAMSYALVSCLKNKLTNFCDAIDSFSAYLQ